MNDIAKARKVMRDAFEAEPDFKMGYIANVAMYLYDNSSTTEFEEIPVRNKMAEGIIDLIFKDYTPDEDEDEIIELDDVVELVDEPVKKIISNKAQCANCEDIIESKHRHDYQQCSCAGISVDGGLDYIRHGFKNEDDLVDLSEYENVEGE